MDDNDMMVSLGQLMSEMKSMTISHDKCQTQRIESDKDINRALEALRADLADIISPINIKISKHISDHEEELKYMNIYCMIRKYSIHIVFTLAIALIIVLFPRWIDDIIGLINKIKVFV